MQIIVRCELTRVPALDRPSGQNQAAQQGFALAFTTGVSSVGTQGAEQDALTARLQAILNAAGTPLSTASFRSQFEANLSWLCPWTWSIEALKLVPSDGSQALVISTGFRKPTQPAPPYVDVVLNSLFEHLTVQLVDPGPPPVLKTDAAAGFDAAPAAAPNEQTNHALRWPVLMSALGVTPAPLPEDAFRQVILFRLPEADVPHTIPFGIVAKIKNGSGAVFEVPSHFDTLPAGATPVIMQWDPVSLSDEIVMQAKLHDPASAVDLDEWSTPLTAVGEDALRDARTTFADLCWVPGAIANAMDDVARSNDPTSAQVQSWLLCNGLLALYSALVLDPAGFRAAPDEIDLFTSIRYALPSALAPQWDAFVDGMRGHKPFSLFDAPAQDEARLGKMVTYLNSLSTASNVGFPAWTSPGWRDNVVPDLGASEIARRFRTVLNWLSKAEGLTRFLLLAWSDPDVAGAAPLTMDLRDAMPGVVHDNSLSWRIRFTCLGLPVRKNLPVNAIGAWKQLVDIMLTQTPQKTADAVRDQILALEDSLLAGTSIFKLKQPPAGQPTPATSAYAAFDSARAKVAPPDAAKRWWTPHSAWTSQPDALVLRLDNLDAPASAQRYGLLLRRSSAADWCCPQVGSVAVPRIQKPPLTVLTDAANTPLWTVYPRLAVLADGFEQVYLRYDGRPLLYDIQAATSGEQIDKLDDFSKPALLPFVHPTPWCPWGDPAITATMRPLAKLPALNFRASFDLAIFQVGTGGVLPKAVAADNGPNNWQLEPRQQIPYTDPGQQPYPASPAMPIPGTRVTYWRSTGVGQCTASYRTLNGDDWRVDRPDNVPLLAKITGAPTRAPQTDGRAPRQLTGTLLLARGVNAWKQLVICVATPMCSFETYVRHIDRSTDPGRQLAQLLRCADLFVRNPNPRSPPSTTGQLVPDPLGLRTDTGVAPLGETRDTLPGGMQLGDPAVTHLIVSLAPIISANRVPPPRRAIPVQCGDIDAIVQSVTTPLNPPIEKLAQLIRATVMGPVINQQRSETLTVTITCAPPGSDARIALSADGVEVSVPSGEVWSLEICPAVIADDPGRPSPFSPLLLSNVAVAAHAASASTVLPDRTQGSVAKVQALDFDNGPLHDYFMFDGIARLVEVADTNAGTSQAAPASKAFVPTLSDGATIDAKTLYDHLTVASKDGDLSVLLAPAEPTGAASDALTRLRYFHTATIGWQVWRWLGRPVPPYPRGIADDVPPEVVDLLAQDNVSLRDAMSAAAQVPYFWDYSGFADRTPDPEVIRARPLVCTWRNSPNAPSVTLHREPLAHISREMLYRFQITLNHRYTRVYAKAAETDTSVNALIPRDVLASHPIEPTHAPRVSVADYWKRGRRPAMLAGRPAPPRVKVILPLTQRATDDASSVASVLLVLNEEHGAIGGLAETLDAAIELTTRRYTYTNPATSASRLEVGPDPVLETSLPGIWKDPTASRATQFFGIQLDGPIGHTFDIGEPEGRYVTSSYIAHAVGKIAPWSLAKVRVRRVVLPEALDSDGVGAPNDGTQQIFSMPGFYSLDTTKVSNQTKITLSWTSTSGRPVLPDLTLDGFSAVDDDIEFAATSATPSVWFVSDSTRVPSHWAQAPADKTMSALSLRVVASQIAPPRSDGSMNAVWEIAVYVRSPASAWRRFAVWEDTFASFDLTPHLNASADIQGNSAMSAETRPCYSAYTQGNWTQFPIDLDRAISLSGLENIRSTITGGTLTMTQWPIVSDVLDLDANARLSAYVLATRRSARSANGRSTERFVGVFGPWTSAAQTTGFKRVNNDCGEKAILDGEVCARILLVQSLPDKKAASADFWSTMFPEVGTPEATGQDATQRIVAMSSPLGDA